MDAIQLKNEIISMAAAKGLTNQQLADLSGVPLSTVAAIRSRNNGRVPSIDTATRLMDALSQLSDEEGAEPMPNPGNLTVSEVSHSLIELYEKTIADKNRWLKILAICLAAVVLFVFAILLYDITHPSIGWFQYQ